MGPKITLIMRAARVLFMSCGFSHPLYGQEVARSMYGENGSTWGVWRPRSSVFTLHQLLCVKGRFLIFVFSLSFIFFFFCFFENRRRKKVRLIRIALFQSLQLESRKCEEKYAKLLSRLPDQRLSVAV